MFKSLVVVAVATLTYASVIPSECFNENLTSHTITKREEKIDDGWMFNSQPIEIGATVEASMAPNLQSRMCEYQDDEQENLRDYFVTMDDVRACDPQIESRNAVQDDIPSKNFIDVLEKANVWIQDQPTNEVPKEYPQEEAFIIEDYPEYLNTRDFEEVIMEPADEDLDIFYNTENLPDNRPNKEVPLIINYKEVPVPKEKLTIPEEKENSEVVAEAKDIHPEILENEKGDEFQVTQDADAPEQSGNGPSEVEAKQEPSEVESKQAPPSDANDQKRKEKLDELSQTLEQLDQSQYKDVEEKIQDLLNKYNKATPKENSPKETNTDTKESILS